jgi:hypothetical protein
MDKLTGKWQLRLGWLGRIILQVEEHRVFTDPLTLDDHVSTVWRDAKPTDWWFIHQKVLPRE